MLILYMYRITHPLLKFYMVMIYKLKAHSPVQKKIYSTIYIVIIYGTSSLIWRNNNQLNYSLLLYMEFTHYNST